MTRAHRDAHTHTPADAPRMTRRGEQWFISAAAERARAAKGDAT